MRKFIFITGLVLVSAAAQAGEPRSLSLAGSDVQRAPVAGKVVDLPRTAEAPPVAEPPKDTERPAVVEPKVETPRAETPQAQTAATQRPLTRAERMAVQRSRVAQGGPAYRRSASMSRGMRMHRPHYRLARFIHTLHRYGIYW
jgi:hypothetical protein